MAKIYPNLDFINASNSILKHLKIFIFFLLLFFSSQINAQSNNCGTTSVLTVGNSCSTTNYNVENSFTNSAIVPSCGPSFRDGWFTFTTDATTTNITIEGTSNRRMGLVLYTGTCASLTEAACEIPNNNSNATLVTNVNANTTYFLRIVRENNANNNDMTGTICVYKNIVESIVPVTGSNSYTLCSGNLYDNGGSTGNYANNSDGYTVLNPSIAGNKIRVSGTLITEGGYDYMTIYDGVGLGGTILWGGAIHSTGTSCVSITVPTITSISGSLTIRYQSDFSNICAGFNLAISCVTTPVPTITTLSSTSGCVGTSLTINGTNLSSASTVTIGGTAATITANTATAITVTVGTGTTGTVAVTTAGGTATSGATFTVNPLPANPGNPTSNSPQCNPPGITLTRTGTPPNGITWYWQTTALGTTTTNSAATYVVTTSGTYYIRARNNTTGCWSSGEGSITVTVTPNLSGVAGTPNPANNATGVCYAGNNSVSSTSWTAVAGATTYDVYFGAGSLPGTVTATVATNSFNTGTLLPNTTYLWKVVPRNACGITSGTPVVWRFITSNSICYCTPTSIGPQYVYIDDVRFMGTLNDVDNLNNGYTNGFQNWTSRPKAIQAQGEGINIYYNNNSYSGSAHVKAWIDWNNNGNFENGELVYDTGGISTSSATFGFIIPALTTPGDYRIRIRNNVYAVGNSTGSYDFNSCENFNYYNPNTYYDGEAEDYLFTVIASCGANITSVVDGENCGSGVVSLQVTGTTGTTGYKWYSSETGATLIASTTAGNWTTPSLSATTTYWVTATNGGCESLKRTKIIAEISPLPTVVFTPSLPIICGENTEVQLTAGGDVETVTLIDEKFEGNGLGAFTNINVSPNGSPYDAITAWQKKTSPYLPTNTQVWSPAISSGLNGNGFAMATSDVNPPGAVRHNLELINPVVATDVTSLNLSFDMYYSSFSDQIRVQVHDGSTWTTVQTYTTSIGIGTRFTNQNISLTAYNNLPSLKIRIQFLSNWGDGVAVDNIKLTGIKTLNTAFTYDTSTINAFSDAACTIPYTGSPASTIWIKPTTTQLENPSFTIPVSTVLSNGCSATGSVVVTNNTRTWQGSTANWNDPNNWKPNNIPTIDNCVVIPSNTLILGTNYNAYGKNLRVKNTGSLNIQPGNNLTIADAVTVESGGTFQIENNSNLVQINNVANTGNIIYKRIAPSIKGSDYVYWSSPVANQAISAIYTSPAQGPRYSWDAQADNGNGTGGNISNGNWVGAPSTMATGSGYIVRGSSSFGMAATDINSTFTGVPNNGTIPVTIYRGSYTGTGYTGANGTWITNLDDNYNLLGNPYPSAINAYKFIYDNNSVMEGNVKLWTHGTNPGLNNGGTITNPFYGSYTYNYSASDYITLNYTGTSIPTTSASIRAGQAFFVEMKDGATGSAVVNFNNSQRRDNSGVPYANDGFFRSAEQQTAHVNDIENLERHRIWLDLKDANNTTETTLVGYIQGATMDSDSPYDAMASSLSMGIYSFINAESFVIQGRSLPFDDNDQVSIGFNVPSAGNYSIAINTADGLFLGTQDIYLKDELLNIYHDLKTNPYSFTATAGVHDSRFKLVYKNTVLSNVTFDQNEIQMAKNRNTIEIVSGNEIMENVKVYDTRGRLLVEKSKINGNSISIDVNNVQDQVLIVNIITAEGIKVTRKIL